MKTTLETSGEDVKTTLETSGEDVKTTLETSGEDVKITLETSGEDVPICLNSLWLKITENTGTLSHNSSATVFNERKNRQNIFLKNTLVSSVMLQVPRSFRV